MPEPSGKCIVRTLHGFALEIDPVRDSGLERSIHYTGTYETGTLHVISAVLGPGDVFADVGANIGLMSILAARAVGTGGKVFSFEPNPETAEIMERNIALNGTEQIELVRKAVGKSSGEAVLYERWDSNRGSASLIDPKFETESHKVEVVSLDEFFADFGRNIGLMKFDIEGFELEALKGAEGLLSQREAPVLIVECSETRANTEGADGNSIFRFIRGVNDYRLFKLSGTKSRKSKLVPIESGDDMPAHDNAFCFLPAHINSLPAALFSQK